MRVKGDQEGRGRVDGRSRDEVNMVARVGWCRDGHGGGGAAQEREERGPDALRRRSQQRKVGERRKDLASCESIGQSALYHTRSRPLPISRVLTRGSCLEEKEHELFPPLFLRLSSPNQAWLSSSTLPVSHPSPSPLRPR